MTNEEVDRERWDGREGGSNKIKAERRKKCTKTEKIVWNAGIKRQ
jgi:hypothetical protein